MSNTIHWLYLYWHRFFNTCSQLTDLLLKHIWAYFRDLIKTGYIKPLKRIGLLKLFCDQDAPDLEINNESSFTEKAKQTWKKAKQSIFVHEWNEILHFYISPFFPWHFFVRIKMTAPYQRFFPSRKKDRSDRMRKQRLAPKSPHSRKLKTNKWKFSLVTNGSTAQIRAMLWLPQEQWSSG